MIKIQAVGIIAEYNPFHNGHYWHVSQAKKESGCNYAIAVMSGHFTQRGEPAAFDKWTRAHMAVAGGVDLIIELPVAFAVRSAEFFAAGGVRLLAALGIVSHLAFGSETPDIKLLQQSADWGGAEFEQALKQRLSTGVTYAAAMAGCMSASGASVDVLSQPNNILAIEYLRAIRRYAPALTPVVIQRRQSHYHDQEIVSPFASASAIRKAMTCGLSEAVRQAVPAASFAAIEQAIKNNRGPVSLADFTTPILYKLRSSTISQLSNLPDVSEGLQHKIASAALAAGSIEELLALIKSKRYTLTRLQRTLLHALLGLDKQQIAVFEATGPLYARILALNANGRMLLKAIARQASVPIINKVTNYLNSKQRCSGHNLSNLQQMLAIDTHASDIYNLAFPSSLSRLGATDFRQSPIYFEHQPTTSCESEAALP